MHLGGVPLLEEAFAAEARRAKHRAQLPGRDRPVPVCPTMSSEEERSAIELRDKEPPAVEKPKHRTMSNPSSKARNDKSSILMPESLPVVPAKAIKGKRQIPEDMFRRTKTGMRTETPLYPAGEVIKEAVGSRKEEATAKTNL